MKAPFMQEKLLDVRILCGSGRVTIAERDDSYPTKSKKRAKRNTWNRMVYLSIFATL